jgi:hypothetical protein
VETTALPNKRTRQHGKSMSQQTLFRKKKSQQTSPQPHGSISRRRHVCIITCEIWLNRCSVKEREKEVFSFANQCSKQKRKGKSGASEDAIDQPQGIESLHNLLRRCSQTYHLGCSVLPADRDRLPSYFEIDCQLEGAQLSFHLLTYLRNAMEGLSFGCARTRVERRSTPSSSNILFMISFVRFSRALLKRGPGKELARHSETARP